MRGSPSARRLVLLGALGIVVVGAAALLRIARHEPTPLVDVPPPGRWTFQAERLAEPRSGEEAARLLSLPYVSGSAKASGRDGVLLYDPDRANNGLNLYVSGHGPEALLIDMQGRPLHRWRYTFEDAFPGKSPTSETAFFRRAYLYPNGDLLALFQGGGMIKLDRDSHLLWTTDLPFYNHLFVTDDGSILSIAKTAASRPELRPGTVLEDSIVTLSPDGVLVDRFSLVDCFASSHYSSLIHPLPSHADIFHTNTVIPITEPPVSSSSPLQPGTLLVSLREIDTIAIVDPDRRTIRAAWRGPWRKQHQPVPDKGGNILLFDNKGANGRSRVAVFDPIQTSLIWEYSGAPPGTLWSPEAGSCQRLPNGNILITESEMGRAFEITPDQEAVWAFSSPHRAGHRDELVATLFEVVRLPPADLTFLTTNEIQ